MKKLLLTMLLLISSAVFYAQQPNPERDAAVVRAKTQEIVNKVRSGAHHQTAAEIKARRERDARQVERGTHKTPVKVRHDAAANAPKTPEDIRRAKMKVDAKVKRDAALLTEEDRKRKAALERK